MRLTNASRFGKTLLAVAGLFVLSALAGCGPKTDEDATAAPAAGASKGDPVATPPGGAAPKMAPKGESLPPPPGFTPK